MPLTIFPEYRKRNTSIDEGDYETYSGPFHLGTYEDGVRTITFRSIDNIGNIEPGNTYTVGLDKEQCNNRAIRL